MSAHSVEKEVKTTKKKSEKIEPPNRYKVVVCNDDVTPVEFVVSMLIMIFKHNEKSALELTLLVHKSGSAVAGTFSYEVAEQKSIDATNLARASGYPLIIKVEPE
jgi:ATP-dependent Clp protease adaptor protein ClpS